MNLLGIDTSSENISLSITCDDKVLVNFNQRIKFGASKIITFIEQCVKESSLTLSKIDAFVVGAGPGSFTGLRISFSIIKAFSLSLNKPVVRLGSFFSMAYPFVKKFKKIAVISDARRGLIYAVSFKVRKNIPKMEGKERLISLQAFVKAKQDYFFLTYDEHLRNDALSFCAGIDFYSQNVWPNASYLIELAKDSYMKKKFTPVDKLEPLYLHHKTCQIRIKG